MPTTAFVRNWAILFHRLHRPARLLPQSLLIRKTRKTREIGMRTELLLFGVGTCARAPVYLLSSLQWIQHKLVPTGP
jgi:hypothetical protein